MPGASASGLLSYQTWNSRNQILRRRLEQSGVCDFVQYRSRGYDAKRRQKRRVPLQVIMQIGGWKREAMPSFVAISQVSLPADPTRTTQTSVVCVAQL